MAHLCVFTKIELGVSSTWIGATEDPYQSLRESSSEDPLQELLPWALFFYQGYLIEAVTNALEASYQTGGWYRLDPEEVTQKIATLSKQSFSGYREWHARARRLKV